MGQSLALLVLGLFLVPLVASNLWGYLQSRDYLTEAAFRNIRNVAALEATETLEFIHSSENLVPTIVAGDEHLFEILRGAGGEDASKTERALHEHLHAKLQVSATAEEFQVISLDGVLLGSSRPGPVAGTDVTAQPCFRDRRPGTRIVGFEYGTDGTHSDEDTHGHGHEDAGESAHEDDEPRMSVATPITDRDGAVLGTFCARFRFDVHRSLLVAHRDRTSQATIYLLDDNQRIVCGSFEDPHHAPYGQRFELFGDLPDRGEPREGRRRLGSGEEVLVAYAPIEELGWGVVVEVPVSRALADLETLKREALAVSAALAVLVLFAIVVSWRTVVRPLRALLRTSERIAGGDIGATVPPAGPREIFELTTAFNRMSLAQRDSHNTLEEGIAARTAELRESQEFSELLLDSIDQRVVVTDRHYRIVKTNAAATRMHGRDLVGALCYQVFEGRAEPCEDCPVRDTLTTGRPAVTERFQHTRQGRDAMRVETYPVAGDGDQVESVIAISRVITAEKQMQARMAYQEKVAAFGQLAAGVAHEIGNPLAAIDSQLRLAQSDPDRAEQTLDVVRREVARMSGLLRELVDFSRRKRHGLKLASANQAVEDVIRLIRHDPRARGVDVRSDLADDLPGVRANEDRLVQVLLNLGLNALDALGQSGSVSFSTAPVGDQVVIRVSDTGPGMTEETRERLFEPFFTTKDVDRGTGLGLFVSKGIIEDLGGKLELERTSSAGTVFTVRVPASGGTHE